MNKNNLSGLSVCSIELTSRCNKQCWMCGRRCLEKEHPELCNWGDMKFSLIKKIAKQLPSGIIIQAHSNGESLLHPRFGEAIKLFSNQIRCMDTNGILIVKKAKEIINNMETLTISVIENDPVGDKQYEIVKEFLQIKGNNKPFIVYRLLGNVTNKERWYKLPGIVATRILHHSMGSYQYTKKVTVPETGLCNDLFSHIVIDRLGDVYPCVRFNPLKLNKLGNVKSTRLIELWKSPYRLDMIRKHIAGRRDLVPLCMHCDFWGIPTSS